MVSLNMNSKLIAPMRITSEEVYSSGAESTKAHLTLMNGGQIRGNRRKLPPSDHEVRS